MTIAAVVVTRGLRKVPQITVPCARKSIEGSFVIGVRLCQSLIPNAAPAQVASRPLPLAAKTEAAWRLTIAA